MRNHERRVLKKEDDDCIEDERNEGDNRGDEQCNSFTSKFIGRFRTQKMRKGRVIRYIGRANTRKTMVNADRLAAMTTMKVKIRATVVITIVNHAFVQ